MKKLGVGLLMGLFMVSLVFALCSDSDGGKNSFKKGYTSDENLVYQDFCIGESDYKIEHSIVENYCLGDDADIVINKCDYKCDKGKCVNKGLVRKGLDYFYSLSYENKEIKQIVDYCVIENSNKALKEIGFKGGAINPEIFTLVDEEKITYGYINGENTLASNGDMEDDIEEYLKAKIPECIKKTYKNEEVKIEDIDVDIKSKEVYVALKASVSNNKVNSKNFFPIKIKDIRRVADKIIKRESEHIDYSELSFLAELGYYIIVTPITDGEVVSIVDQSVSIDNEPFVFRFAMRDTKALMSLKDEGFLQNIFDLFGIYGGGTITDPYTGTVKESECLEGRVYNQELSKECYEDGYYYEKYDICEGGELIPYEYQYGPCEMETYTRSEIQEVIPPELTGCFHVSAQCSLSGLSEKGLIINPDYTIIGDNYPLTNNVELATIGIFKSQVNDEVYYKLSEYIGDETTYCSKWCVSVKELGDYDFSSINLLALNHNKKSGITGNIILGGTVLLPASKALIESIIKNPAIRESVIKGATKEGIVALDKALAKRVLQEGEITLLNAFSQKCLSNLANEITSSADLAKLLEEQEGTINIRGETACPSGGVGRFADIYKVPPLPEGVKRTDIFSRTDYQGKPCPEIDVKTEPSCPASPIKTEGSFLADTKIMMADGSYKNIQDILLGEEVMAYDIFNNKPEIAPVTYTFNYPEASYRIIEYEVVE